VQLCRQIAQGQKEIAVQDDNGNPTVNETKKLLSETQDNIAKSYLEANGGDTGVVDD
jgi:hypothetical protein